MGAQNNVVKKNAITKEKNKKFAIRTILTMVVIAIFAISSFISFRADYLYTIEIGKQYESVFYQKVINRYTVLGVAFVILYLLIYMNNVFIKKGLKKFFKEENKDMPKLPNKTLCVILGIIGSVIATNLLADKFSVFSNAAVFGQSDKIFGADIGYYIFQLPFIQSILIFIIEVLVALIIYTAIYYVIVLNTYFDGVNVETLKKNTFIKQEIFIVILITIVFCVYVFINAQNILTGNMVTVGEDNSIELVGAGKTDVTIKLWGYRILSFIIAISVFRLLKYVKKGNFKQSIISVAIVPIYLLCMFLSMTYFQFIYVRNNELDNEKEYISYHIASTKEAYGINIDQKNIDSYHTITSEEVNNNQYVINNIPLITKDVTLTSVAEHQENSVYYRYDNTFLDVYRINNENKLVYITPREILADASISYNNRTLTYTHGYSVVASTATDADNNGYTEYILSDFKNTDTMHINEPRIYFGLETNSTIMTNTTFGKEYDYPITPTTYNENIYNGEAGLTLGFFDRLILAINQKNFKLAFSSNITEDTKVISHRNIIERAKKILPDVLYDENPYLVITDTGRLVWVLDGYTRSADYPYAQSTTINIKGYKEKINYIRNSVKILIDAYDGTTTFYITDRTDPIIMTYRNMYPDLFEDLETPMPEDIAQHMKYPQFLYDIQARMINIYHDVSEDVLYRADDIWQITTKANSNNPTIPGIERESYYTMLKTIDHQKAELGLVLTFNKLEKQNITAYLVGTVDRGKPQLSLYKFSSESNVVGIMQLNNQIEQDATIAEELETLNTSGTKLIKDMIIVPINNTLLYVEPVYQVMLNETEIPVLKKVIIASGNTVAIGDNLNEALTNLFNDEYAVDIEFIDTEDVEALIDSVIKANNNLTDSLNANDFEMIGKDITSLQTLIHQLQAVRENEKAEQDKLKEQENQNNISNTQNAVENMTNILNSVQ